MKNKLFWILAFFVILVVFGGVLPYMLTRNTGQYAIGITFKRVREKNNKTLVHYKYTVDGKEYTATYLEGGFFSNQKSIDAEDGTYLIIYASSWPRYSQLLEQFPVDRNFNVDSLNKAGLDKSLVEFW